MFGNLPLIAGQTHITNFIMTLFALVAGVEHRIERFWELPERVAFTSGTVMFTQRNGNKETVPFATHSQFDGERRSGCVQVDKISRDAIQTLAMTQDVGHGPRFGGGEHSRWPGSVTRHHVTLCATTFAPRSRITPPAQPTLFGIAAGREGSIRGRRRRCVQR